MSKSWAIFFLIVGLLVLSATALQIVFVLNPTDSKTVAIYNPATPNPDFPVEVLYKIALAQKGIYIDSDTIAVNIFKPFILIDRYSYITSSQSSTSGN